MFLDWEKVSFRNDPTFTLVRFATSAHTEEGLVPYELFETLLDTYKKEYPIANFFPMALARLFERQVSDLVWVLWDYSRQKNNKPVEQATSVARRYEEVQKMLEKY